MACVQVLQTPRWYSPFQFPPLLNSERGKSRLQAVQIFLDNFFP